MKFCKNLQRVVDISDPEWAPYWPNYKMLKKLIKELPSLVPAEDAKPTPEPPKNNTGSSQKPQNNPNASAIGKSPGEVAFFKLLHSEFKKVTMFFERASEEYKIREERVQEGMAISKQANSIMVNEKWSLMAKSIHRLYKDLLLLETFAIMTYCSFSKILKKHDKVTGYETRSAFMENVVNKANFTHYPHLLEMISRSERMHEQVSQILLREGKEGLYEDERLFINMINRLNEQVLNGEDSNSNAIRKDTTRRLSLTPLANKKESSEASTTAAATSTLRAVLEDTQNANNAKIEASDDGGSHHHHDNKRPAATNIPIAPDAKRRAV
ncbi:unnamed protein product [Cylindrotheca closterium]|uniref:SPX domain-containing protein n=1 Tax=Cylindrotheca closterium TaxID=2856 RepID=A0AAD2CC57_9STRA|nr:unnamed protein product [Cylindrotheca closterium]